jgi:hypothetical protein
VRFIDEHKSMFGIEPIWRALTAAHLYSFVATAISILSWPQQSTH